MILNMENKKDQIFFNRLQKGQGIQLIQKFLSELSVYQQVWSVNTIAEWRQIKDQLPEIVTVRTDNISGSPIPKIGGTTCAKEAVESDMKSTIEKEGNPYFLCMELEEGTGERIDTKGGFCLDVTMGNKVYIGYTRPCFDCRELTKGKAEHETWEIPWNELRFMNADNYQNWHKNTITKQAYQPTAIERIIFLVEQYPERKKEIIDKMPGNFEEIDPFLMQNLIQQVIKPIWWQRRELLEEGLEQFCVELNILENGRLVPFEMFRPERFRQQNKQKEGKRDETR